MAYKARAFYGLGRKDDSYKLFDSILAVDSYDPYGSLLYSRVLAEENKNPDKAQNLARQAVLISDPTQQPTLNLAYVYLKTGRPDLATGAGMRGVEMYPQDPEAYFLLGWAQSAANKPGAKENLQKAISLGLTGTQLQAAKELLAKN
jgi:tetratricopeptide (TPR) repeat protein